MPTPPSSPSILLSQPSVGERLARCTAPSTHSSPPHGPSPLLPSSGCPTQIQTLRITSTQALVDAVTTALPSPPLPPLPPSLYIPLPVDCRDDIPESERPPHKRLCLSTLGPSTLDAKERRRGIREVGYGIRDTWVDPAEAVPEIAPMTVREVNTRVTELAELHEHDTQDLYALLEDAQDSRTRISQRVTIDSQRVDLLIEDRIAHQETILIVEEEAYASREAWAHVIGLSQAFHYELQTHCEQVYAHESQLHAHQTQLQLQSTFIQTQHQVYKTRFQMQQAKMAKLQETDHRRQAQMALLRKLHTYGVKHSLHGDNRRNVQTARPCFYDDFMKCQPLNFKGNEGVVSLTRWIEKMEFVFNISGCTIENQVKGNDVPTYIKRFQELTLICKKFVANETEKVDKYISGLLDNIYGNVKSSRPKTLDETIELANDLIDQKLHTYVERQTVKQKVRRDDSSRQTMAIKQTTPFRDRNVAKVLATQIGLNAQKDNKAVPKGNGCFECGALGHFKRDCLKLKNKDGGNGNAQG
ncbi:putative reverse transcriptase domain-containing protein [Tanacetum coccineum]